jgi:hypothetical protein
MNDLLTQERIPHETNVPTLPQATDKALSDDSISDLFNTRDQVRDNTRDRARGPVPDPKLSLNRDQKNPTKHSHSQEQTQSPQEDLNRADLSKQEETKKNAEAPKGETSKQEEPPLELQGLQEELSKTQKRLLENQQYGRQNAQRLKTALKVVKELEAEGSLSEEEAARLVESLDRENGGENGEDPIPEVSHPFGKVMAIANQELENIRKYTDDELLDDKVGAFDYFLLVASKEEREQALEDLTELIPTPLPLAKKMLSIGHGYEASYREMKAAGSLYGLLTKKDQEASDLRKNLDKLTKKLAQYEDYDKPRYRLEEMGESMGQDPSGDTITSLFEDRDRIKRR